MTANDRNRFYAILGDKIRSARIKAGLKQEAFADLLKLSRASIVNIEKGRQHTPIHALWDIAKILGIGVTELLPQFSHSEKVKPELKKLAIKELKGDSLSQEKIIGFLSEVQIQR